MLGLAIDKLQQPLPVLHHIDMLSLSRVAMQCTAMVAMHKPLPDICSNAYITLMPKIARDESSYSVNASPIYMPMSLVCLALPGVTLIAM